MPKFLWRHIIQLLPVAAILNMTIIDQSFDDLINDNDWKRYFLEERDCAIAVVMSSRQVDNFWKYAFYNHRHFNKIDDALKHIEDINGLTLKYNYTIFIQTGKHIINNYASYTFYCECSIKVIGSTDRNTIISSYDNITENIDFYIPRYFSIENISLLNIILNCAKSSYEYKSNIHISNCHFTDRFSVNNHDTVCITNCTFNNAPLYIVDINILDKTKAVNYLISNNIFTNTYYMAFMYFKSMNNKSSIITVTDNIFIEKFQEYSQLMRNEIEYGTVTVKNNIITNISTCNTSNCVIFSDIIYENNVFTNVKSFIDKPIDSMKLSSNNTFIDCGTDLTKYITE